MRIAILGTRGIPNHYGGFEQYAELLATYLVAQGWEVTVYNSHNHPYKESIYKGVNIKHIYDPEKKMGTIGQFFYDLGCILDSRKQHYDVIYQLGYTSSAIFNFLFPKDAVIVTNMDGMEWKRSKYNKYVQRFLMYSERIAVKRSHYLVADSLGIKEYLDRKYNKDSFYSAYTANIPNSFSESDLLEYNLVPYQYNLIVARLEPENNVETIMKAHTLNGIDSLLIVIGNHNTPFGSHLKTKFKQYPNILFIGGVYHQQKLNSLRHYAQMYFHGHSVGGTNPSLLEAMACSCKIIAHSNIFNQSVLGEDALFFDNAESLNKIIINFNQKKHFFEMAMENNLQKIRTIFSEQFIFYSLKEKLIDWLSQSSGK